MLSFYRKSEEHGGLARQKAPSEADMSEASDGRGSGSNNKETSLT